MYESPNMTPAVKLRHNVEKRIVKKVVATLIAVGYVLNVDDGDGEVLAKPTTDKRVLHKALMNTDEDYLFVYKHYVRVGWVFFVYGNDGWDVISDYTLNLEKVLAPINKYCEVRA